MSDLIRSTVYLTKKNKNLLANVSFVTKETRIKLVNEALEKYLNNLVKEKGIEKLINDLSNK